MTDLPPLLLLDGATGTELTRRGIDTHGPAWSAPAITRAPDVLAAIHEEHARAGADVITANTFRTQRRALSRIGQARRAREWTFEAVRIAREAAARVTEELGGDRRIRVAGSIAPLEDSYSPELAPDEATARREHHEHAGHLAEAGVDVLLVETMTTIAEASAATAAAASTGLETWSSVTTDRSGARLLSGEPLEGWVEAVARFRPAALLVNCIAPGTARSAVTLLAPLAHQVGALPGAYANLGSSEPIPDGGFDIALQPDAYAEAAKGLLDAGARILGGCCGTTPEHTRALRTLLDERMAAESKAVQEAEAGWRMLVARAGAMAGGGRALVVGNVDAALLPNHELIRPKPDELARLPEGRFRLAVVEGDPGILRSVATALEPGGWLVARSRALDGLLRAADGAAELRLEGFEIHEIASAAGSTAILARRSV